jgi:hypothetical protein
MCLFDVQTSKLCIARFALTGRRSLEKAKLFFGEDAVTGGRDKDEENYRWAACLGQRGRGWTGAAACLPPHVCIALLDG